MPDGKQLYHSGDIYTVDETKPTAEAVAVKDGTILAVGDEALCRAALGDGFESIDLEGCCLLPGFIDTHVHPLMTGNAALNVDLAGVASVGEICGMLKKRAEITPHGELVKGMNFNYDTVKEKRLPTLTEMDAISSDHPVFIIVADAHSAMFNSAGLKLIEILKDIEGVILDENGNRSGLIEDPAIIHVHKIIASKDESMAVELVQAVNDEALKVGITTIHAKEGPNVIKKIILNEQTLSIRIKPLVIVSDKAELESVLNEEIFSGRAAIAIFADGAPDSRTSAFFEPYAEDPFNYGTLYYCDEELEGLIETAHRAGVQVSVHTCGTRAIEQVISIYENVLNKYPRKDHRHRIEHFEIPFGNHIERTVSAGIALAMQPAFLFLLGKETFAGQVRLLGKERAERWTPLRGILDRGGLIGGGSDSPISRMNPLKGIYASVSHPVKKHRINLYEAIRLFTVDAAKIGFEEESKGKIEVGKLADFVVLSSDPFQTPIDQITSIGVEKTIIGGKTVYRRSKA